jgi:hypothetical protein
MSTHLYRNVGNRSRCNRAKIDQGSDSSLHQGRFFLLFFGCGAEESLAFSSSVAAKVGEVNICLYACEFVEHMFMIGYDVHVP